MYTIATLTFQYTMIHWYTLLEKDNNYHCTFVVSVLPVDDEEELLDDTAAPLGLPAEAVDS